MTWIIAIALGSFMLAGLTVWLVVRRLCAAPLAWIALGAGGAMLTAIAIISPTRMVLANVGVWLLGMPPGSTAYGILASGIVAPLFEELFRAIFVLLALAYLPGRGGSSWAIGLGLGLAWGLGELFLRSYPFVLLWAGVELSPTTAIMGTTTVAVAQDAAFLFAARLAVVVWHGAITVLMIFGLRAGMAWPIGVGVGAHLAGNTASILGERALAPYSGSFAVNLLVAVSLLLVARLVTYRARNRTPVIAADRIA